MPSKIEISLTPEQLQEFFKRCSQLKGTKLKDIQSLAEEFGIEISLMSASAFREGAFRAHLEKIERARSQVDQIKALMADGTDALDASLKIMAAELIDRMTNGEDVDLVEVSKILQRLITSRARKDTVDQNAQKLAADLKLRDEQIARLERDRTEWEDQRRKVAAQVERVKTASPASADDVRAAAVAEIDRIMGITPKAKK